MQPEDDVQSYIKNNVQRQPYIACLGKLDDISADVSYYVAIDAFVIQASSFLRAFEVLFKAHYVFNLDYEASLKYVYDFFDAFIFQWIDAVQSETVTNFYKQVRN